MSQLGPSRPLDRTARRCRWGQSYGRGEKGLAALVIEWDGGLHVKHTTEAIAAELEQARRKSGVVAQNIGGVDRGMASALTKVEATYHRRTPLRSSARHSLWSPHHEPIL
jgi:hypothetical protein